LCWRWLVSHCQRRKERFWRHPSRSRLSLRSDRDESDDKLLIVTRIVFD